MPPIAIQLYSVRDHLLQDVPGTLASLRESGYQAVELAGTAGLTNEAFRDALADAQLQPVSAHIGFDELSADLEQVVAFARCFGMTELVCPWLGGEGFDRIERWSACAQRLDAAGEQLRAEGIRLSYHNHEHEFMEVEGQRIFDVLLENASPEHLSVQLDVGWAVVGGVDAIALMEQLGPRLASIHVKQFRNDGSRPMVCELDAGMIDYGPIVAAALRVGARDVIMEQDDSDTDSLDSARRNAAALRQLYAA